MKTIAPEESNLVTHARRELKTLGEDPDTIEGYLKVVQAFADMRHSGGSAVIAISVLQQILQFQNLTPLTDDPNEWFFHDSTTWGSEGGVWQNIRNGEAFSHDGGKTYYLLSEGANDANRSPIHESRYKKSCHFCGANGPSDHVGWCRNHPSRFDD